MNPTFWRGKRVLVTGHTGFKGSWLCQLLTSFGAEVAGYALTPPTQPNLYSLARIHQLVESTTADICDLGSLTDCIQEFAPDVVFHMAAQSVVLQSYENPVQTYSTNVLGTVNTLDAIRRMGHPCVVVNVTTDKCYENKGWVWGYRETDTLGGRDPYSNSKACAELVARSFRESFFPLSKFAEHRVVIASARAGNVIGGGDWTPRQLIPESVAAFAKAQSVVLRHPHAVRPWQHVLDCLGGYVTLAEALASDPKDFSGEWNFGPSDSETCSVSRIVESLATHWSVQQPWVLDEASHSPEEQQLRLDINKTANLLGWRCRLTLDNALQWVATWYREYQNGRDARSLCREQIDRYLNLESR